MDRRWWLTVVVVGLLGAVALATVVPVVSAHAHLGESDPDNGERLDEVPAEILLSYTGDGIEVADVVVTGPNDEDVSGEAEVDPYNEQLVTVPIEDADAGDGMYIVEWEVLADDGHTTSGSFFFSVGDEPLDREAVLATHESALDGDMSWFEAAGKGLVLVALATVIGVPVAAAGAVFPVLRRHEQADSDSEISGVADLTASVDRSVRLLCAGLAVLLVLAVVGFGAARVRSLGALTPETATAFLGTSVGTIWLVQAVVAVSLAVFALVGLRGALSRRVLLGGTAAGGVALAGTVAWTSHSATAIDRFRGLTVDVVHIVAAGVWVGSLLVLVIFLGRLRRTVETPTREPLAGAAVGRFSVLALGGATFTVATGLVLGSWHVTESAGLTGTVYGTVLLVKLALVVAALAFGGYHRFVLLPRLKPTSAGMFHQLFDREATRSDGGQSAVLERLGTTVRLEVVVLVCVLLLAGAMTSTATAAVVLGDAGAERESLTADLDDGVSVELAATPTAPATIDNRITVAENGVVVFDVTFEKDGEPVTSDRSVELLATTSDRETTIERELEAVGDGSYSVVQTLPEHGLWEVRVTGTLEGSFESAWFEVHAMPDIDHGHDDAHGDTHDHGHDDHVHGDAHDHGHDDHSHHDHGSDSPLALAGVLVGLYGALAVAYEANSLRRREE